MKISECLCIDMYAVSNKVEGEEFESEVKTGNGSSFVRHFDEKPSKTVENRRKSVRVSRIRGPLELGGPRRCPPIAGPTPNTPSVPVSEFLVYRLRAQSVS